MRVIFMGTPDFAVPTLAAIVGQGHEVVAAYTRAPARAGRGMDEKPSPIHRMAESLGIPVFTPASLKGEEAAAQLRALDPDVVVVVAYGMLLPKSILDIATEGCLNLHGSLLPRWRGAAPIQRAIMAGDAETGVMVMRMEEGLDTGPVAMVERIVIDPAMTAGQLHDRMMVLGADLMVRALSALSRGSLSFTPQAAEGVTYARKIENAEARIDFALPATALYNQIRGVSPFPGAFFEADFGKGRERIKLLRAEMAQGKVVRPGTLLDEQMTIACGEGAIRILEAQRAGGKPLPGDVFLRGTRLVAGDCLA
jgi:methionyl-tRNA formyltransferase